MSYEDPNKLPTPPALGCTVNCWILIVIVILIASVLWVSAQHRAGYENDFLNSIKHQQREKD